MKNQNSEVDTVSDRVVTYIIFPQFFPRYNQELQRLEQESRNLRMKQKSVKESVEESTRQKIIFSQLENLVRQKLECISHYSHPGGSNNLYVAGLNGMRPAVDLSHGRVDRIVIGD